MQRRWVPVALGLALVATGACANDQGHTAASTTTSTTVQAGAESTTTTTLAVVTPIAPPTIDVADPAGDRAPVRGWLVAPTPALADLCKAGYAKKNTPPASVTDPIKASQVVHGPYADKDPTHYVEDELIPVELGGAPADPRNLWPQRPDMATLKDREETRLHNAVCNGQMTLAAAQLELLQNWGPLPKS